MKKRSMIATGMAASLVLAACGGGGEGTGGGEVGDVGVSPELNVAFNAQPPTMDPLT